MLSRVYSQHLFIINQEKGVEIHQKNCALCSVMMISFQEPVSPFMNSSCLMQERYLRLREEKCVDSLKGSLNKVKDRVKGIVTFLLICTTDNEQCRIMKICFDTLNQLLHCFHSQGFMTKQK